MFQRLLLEAAQTLANEGLPNVSLGDRLEKAGDGSCWIDWLDNESNRLGQVAYTDTGKLIQVHYLG